MKLVHVVSYSVISFVMSFSLAYAGSGIHKICGEYKVTFGTYTTADPALHIYIVRIRNGEIDISSTPTMSKSKLIYSAKIDGEIRKFMFSYDWGRDLMTLDGNECHNAKQAGTMRPRRRRSLH